eukprot:PhF_6_TR31357/c0_g1_i2/m.45885
MVIQNVSIRTFVLLFTFAFIRTTSEEECNLDFTNETVSAKSFSLMMGYLSPNNNSTTPSDNSPCTVLVIGTPNSTVQFSTSLRWTASSTITKIRCEAGVTLKSRGVPMPLFLIVAQRASFENCYLLAGFVLYDNAEGIFELTNCTIFGIITSPAPFPLVSVQSAANVQIIDTAIGFSNVVGSACVSLSNVSKNAYFQFVSIQGCYSIKTACLLMSDSASLRMIDSRVSNCVSSVLGVSSIGIDNVDSVWIRNTAISGGSSSSSALQVLGARECSLERVFMQQNCGGIEIINGTQVTIQNSFVVDCTAPTKTSSSRKSYNVGGLAVSNRGKESLSSKVTLKNVTIHSCGGESNTSQENILIANYSNVTLQIVTVQNCWATTAAVKIQDCATVSSTDMTVTNTSSPQGKNIPSIN